MTLFVALVALAITLLYIYVLYLRAELGLMSLLATSFLNLVFGLDSSILGGIHLNLLDVVSVCMIIAGCIRTAQSLDRLNAIRIIALLYVGVLAFSVVRGFFSNGLMITFNESRGITGQLLCMLYFLTAPSDEKSLRKYVRIYLFYGAALCAVAALAAMGLSVGTNVSAAMETDGRFLPASGVAGIAVCGFLSLALLRYRQGGLKNQLILVMYMFIAVYLRHRSVWTMLLVGTIVLLPLDRRLFRRLLPFALAAGALVAVLVLYGGSAQGGGSSDQFSKSATDDSTWVWRVNGWKELLLDDEQNALSVALGKSMGSGFSRIDQSTHLMIDYAPHSEYVFEYLRVGLIGLVLLLLFALRPLVIFWRFTKVDPMLVYPSTSAWAVIVAAILAYGVSYSVDGHLFAMLGLANATVLGLNAPDAECVPDEVEEWELASTSSPVA
jgi:energy-converting hydrogenase Eha subunit C